MNQSDDVKMYNELIYELNRGWDCDFCHRQFGLSPIICTLPCRHFFHDTCFSCLDPKCRVCDATYLTISRMKYFDFLTNKLDSILIHLKECQSKIRDDEILKKLNSLERDLSNINQKTNDVFENYDREMENIDKRREQLEQQQNQLEDSARRENVDAMSSIYSRLTETTKPDRLKKIKNEIDKLSKDETIVEKQLQNLKMIGLEISHLDANDEKIDGKCCQIEENLTNWKRNFDQPI